MYKIPHSRKAEIYNERIDYSILSEKEKKELRCKRQNKQQRKRYKTKMKQIRKYIEKDEQILLDVIPPRSIKS